MGVNDLSENGLFGWASSLFDNTEGFDQKVDCVYENADKYTAGDREIKDLVESIFIDYQSGSVEVVNGESDVLEVKELAGYELDEEHRVHTFVDGKVLYIQFCTCGRGFDFSKSRKQLEVILPAGNALTSLSVKTTSGTIRLDKLEAQAFTVSSASGNVTAALKGRKINVSNASGNIMLEQKGDSEEVVLKAASGALELNMDNSERVTATTASGYVNVNAGKIDKLYASTASGQCSATLAQMPAETSLHTSSGRITACLPEEPNVTANIHSSSGRFVTGIAMTQNGDVFTCGTGENKMDISTSSGDIRVFSKE